MSTAVLPASVVSTLRDVVALTKPRITLMVVITAAGGMWLAPNAVDPRVIALMLTTTAMVVAAANALNCYLERDSDRFMERTRLRPLPDGRLDPKVALFVGIALGLVSVPALTFAVNPLTGLLGAIALVSYVAVYTPMKPISPTALLVGAVPGALPPLMGWTAATGSLDAPGLVLFAIMFIWQVPHFIAISIFRQEEYERAGLKVLPSVRGLAYSKIQAALYAALLVPVSLLLYPLRVSGPYYLATAVVLGAVFAGTSFYGLRESAGREWARKLFIVSLVYLTVLFAAILLDAR
jgi:protoheme IX farnesyltransferase